MECSASVIFLSIESNFSIVFHEVRLQKLGGETGGDTTQTESGNYNFLQSQGSLRAGWISTTAL